MPVPSALLAPSTAALWKQLWAQKNAARELDISPRALNYRIIKLGITHSRWHKNR